MGRASNICSVLLSASLLVGCGGGPKENNSTLKGFPKSTKQPESLQPYLEEAAIESSVNHQYAEAASYWGAIYDTDPANINAALQYAANLRYSSNASDAVNIMGGALKSHPGDARLLSERGKAYAALGAVEPALEDLTKAIAASPSDWTTHSALGVIHDRLGRQAEAEAAYRKALSLSPDNPKVLNNLALSIALAGRHDEAVEILRRAGQLPNTTLQVRQNLSLLLAMQGDVKQAGQLARADLPNLMAANNQSYFEGLSSGATP
jgi:Flp pilus assembly protein TadD